MELNMQSPQHCGRLKEKKIKKVSGQRQPNQNFDRRRCNQKGKAKKDYGKKKKETWGRTDALI